MTNIKKNKKIKNKKKGFTLVELLAVIIILAIVVGITIPAVLTTTNKAREKAFKTAAQTAANWFDRQYEVETTSLDGTGMAKLDSNYKAVCIRQCTPPSTEDCSCDERVNFITADLAIAAGLTSSNIKINDSISTVNTNVYGTAPNSRVYINSKTGKSCVTLIATDDGDYPAGKIACGGSCQSTDTSKKDYCKSTT